MAFQCRRSILHQSLCYLTVGTFGLTFDERPITPPANDVCQNASLLNSGMLDALGTTEGATLESGDVICGEGVVTEENLAPDVWYQFMGTGGVVVFWMMSILN